MVVSVVIITYQHHLYIRECLDSILAQETNFPFEIILGEDGSTDDTKEICQEYAQRYPDVIRLFLRKREDNIKVYGKPTGRFNLLQGMRDARGKYVAVCEGDDYWTDPYKLQKQVDFLEANDRYDLCYTNVELLRNGEVLDDHRLHWKGEFNFFDSLQAPQGRFLTAMYRRAALNVDLLHRTTIMSAMADWPLEVLLTLNKNAFRLPEITARYRQHTSGASAGILRVPYNSLRSRLRFCELLLQESIVVDANKHKFLLLFIERKRILLSIEKFRHRAMIDGLQGLFFGIGKTLKQLSTPPYKTYDWIDKYSYRGIGRRFLMPFRPKKGRKYPRKH